MDTKTRFDADSSEAPLSLKDFVGAARARVPEVSVAELMEMMRARPDLLVVDVRESSEHEQSHIEGALLVPRGILEAAADPDYPKHVDTLCDARTRPVVTYCATGGRSAMAAATLQLMGFREVYSLEGGISAWEETGGPLVRGARYV
ncbi:MAG TPA: rhodanese-like domain-containing protein [Gammaproteobacteria bacterium]|nr:rhodanese-like domain-containing protein [Gammaproteobacteria bacterium]